MNTDVKWQEEVDVVVVGSGFAGLAAAITAKEQGATVLVLEKRNSCGGNSIFSDGILGIVNKHTRDKNGLIDSPNLLMKEMLDAGRGYADEKLVKVLVEQANQTFEWLVNDIGSRFQERVDQFGGHSIARSYTPVGASGKELISPMLDKFLNMGGIIKTRTLFIKFLTNEKKGIIGIAVQSIKKGASDELVFIKVKKGIVLASGGFSGDISLRLKYDKRLDESLDDTNLPDTTAQALLAAVTELEALTVNLNYIQLGPWTSPDEKSYGSAPIFAAYAVFQYGLMVDTVGKRFVNELADRTICTNAMLELGQPCVGIADAQGIELAGQNIERGLKKGVVKKYNTLTELAQEYHIPVKTLAKTIEAYNIYVKNGHDESFGKPILKDSKPLKAPYFACRLWPKVHYTMGGLKINEKAQVISKNKFPIPNLFAAGEVTGGVHGACRLSTLAVTDCLVFGRIAGRNVCQ